MPNGVLNLVTAARRSRGGEHERCCWEFCRALIYISNSVVDLCSDNDKASLQSANELLQAELQSVRSGAAVSWRPFGWDGYHGGGIGSCGLHGKLEPVRRRTVQERE